MVRSKFKVNELRQIEGQKVKLGVDGKPIKNERGYDTYEPATQVTIIMSPVYGNGDAHHENTKFWQNSPSGKLELNCVNENASAYYQLGKEYYVDFTLAE